MNERKSFAHNVCCMSLSFYNYYFSDPSNEKSIKQKCMLQKSKSRIFVDTILAKMSYLLINKKTPVPVGLGTVFL